MFFIILQSGIKVIFSDNHNALKQIPEVYSNVLDRIKCE